MYEKYGGSCGTVRNFSPRNYLTSSLEEPNLTLTVKQPPKNHRKKSYSALDTNCDKKTYIVVFTVDFL